MKVKRIIVMLCIFAISITMIIPVSAATSPEGDSIQASDYLTYYNARVSAGSSGKIYIYFDVIATGSVARVGAKMIVVEKLDAGTWTPVQTTTGTLANGLLIQNDSSHSGSWVYSGTVGNTYRAVVTVYVGPVSGGDSRVITTNSVVAKSS